MYFCVEPQKLGNPLVMCRNCIRFRKGGVFLYSILIALGPKASYLYKYIYIIYIYIFVRSALFFFKLLPVLYYIVVDLIWPL